jgi:hypothetical protein
MIIEQFIREVLEKARDTLKNIPDSLYDPDISGGYYGCPWCKMAIGHKDDCPRQLALSALDEVLK